jgi:two-component system, NarL family, response regulator DesR
VAEVERGDQVLDAIRGRDVDVALLDIEMPGRDGISVAGQIAAQAKQTRSLILTTFGRPGYVRRAIEVGAGGFLLKDAPADALADAIREVHAGRRVIDPGLAATAIADGVSPLTERERDVLVAARTHDTAAQIAASLYLSEGTVRNYLSAGIRKLGARNRAEALRIADEKGWL